MREESIQNKGSRSKAGRRMVIIPHPTPKIWETKRREGIRNSLSVFSGCGGWDSFAVVAALSSHVEESKKKRAKERKMEKKKRKGRGKK